MKIAIPKEVAPGETRVALVPETAAKLVRDKLGVVVEAGAGQGAYVADGAYTDAGAAIEADAGKLFAGADVVVKVAAPTTDDASGRNELAMLKRGQVLVALLSPLVRHDLVRTLAAAGVTSLSLDAIPRITRAQSMDVLSSMSTIAGYKAVLLAADAMAKLVPMMMTAAGTLRPAAALVLGAGVAGLQAIATAKRIGAVVTAMDVRPAVKEQIESLGARFVAMEAGEAAETEGGYAADLGEAFYRRQQEIVAPHAAGSDMIITTALIPGRKAPVLITEAMVETMKPGSVIVDLAAPAGGNCALTRLGETVTHAGVRVVGPVNLAAEMPIHASQMFSRNVHAFLRELINDEGELNIDMENEVIRGALITRDGEVVHEATRQAMGG